MILELGSAKRFALLSCSQQEGPMEAAMPMHSVDTLGLMNCMVSKIDIPALTLPPGELMYRRCPYQGFTLQEQQLGHKVGRLVVDRAHQENHTLAQQRL